MKNFRLRTGSVIGSEHQRLLKNCQDAWATYENHEYIVSVICDGSSTRSIIHPSIKKPQIFYTHSEVGAYLIAEFVKNQIINLLQQGYSLNTLCELVYHRLIDYLEHLLNLNKCQDEQERIYYLTHYLSATILGFIITRHQGIIFSAGDGVTIINDQIQIIDQKNMPNFASYHLLPRHILPDGIKLDKKFKTKKIMANKLRKMAIASDGFKVDQFPELIKNLWDKEHVQALQRQLVIWSRQDKFSDDTTVISLERIN